MFLKRGLIVLLVVLVAHLDAKRMIPFLFDTSFVHKVFIQSSDSTLLTDMSSLYRRKDKSCIKVDVRVDDFTYSDAGIREKGTHSNAFAWTEKKPLKIVFDEFKDENHFGVSRVNLANAFEDPSFLRDVVSLNCLSRLGVPAPKASHAAVYLNDDYLGLYILIEQVDKRFLLREFGEASGNLYKGAGGCFDSKQQIKQKYFELKTNKKEKDRSGLKNFVMLVSEAEDDAFADSIEHYLNVQSFLQCMAFDFIGANTDSYVWGRCHNFYLYEKESGQFEWIAWDYNLSFGYDLKNQIDLNLPSNNVTKDIPLLQRILEVPEYQIAFHESVERARDLLRSRDTRTFIKQQHKMIEPWVKRDTNAFYPFECFQESLSGKPLSSGLNANVPAIFKHIEDQSKKYK